MKHLLFSFAALFICLSASAQGYVEVSGYASRNVVPDEFTLAITIVERDTRAMGSLKEQEHNIVKTLNSIGIDASKALKLVSNYYTNERRSTAKGVRDYELMVKGSDNLNKAFAALADLKPWSLSLTKATCTNTDVIYDELRIEAIQNARDRASTLAAAIDQKIGDCIYISEYGASGHLDFYVPKAASARERINEAITFEESYVSPVEYSSRELSHNLSAKFELLGREE